MNVNFKNGIVAKVHKMGVRGRDGRMVEMRSVGAVIEWRYEGDTDWMELIDIEAMVPAVSRPEIIAQLGFEPAREDHTHLNATQTRDGFMSSTDKTKLNSVEAGAEKNVVLSVAGEIGHVSRERLIQVLDIRPATDFASAADGVLARNSLQREDAANFATSSDGALARTAVQPATLQAGLDTKLTHPRGTVNQLIDGTGALQTIQRPVAQVQSDWNATTGLGVILNKPVLGTAASANTTDFATRQQGLLASTAVQPAALDNYSLTTHTHAAVTTTANGFMIFGDKVKLDGIATGATRNSTDAQLRDRTTHTGEQPISATTGLRTELDGLATGLAGKLNTPTGTADQFLDGTGQPKDLAINNEPIVIVASGQSNMAIVLDEPTNDFDYPDNLWYWNFAGWEGNLGDLFRRILPTETSAAMAFGAQVAKANPNSQVYIICVAFGGQSITTWSENQPIASRTTLYTNVDAALAVINHPTGKPIDYYLWWQGEADATMPRTEYFEHFKTWTDSLDSQHWYDPFDTVNVMYGMVDIPRRPWENYTFMNRRLRELNIELNRRYVTVDCGHFIEDMYWNDDVHMSSLGYWEYSTNAWKACNGEIQPVSAIQYAAEDQLTGSFEVTGNGLKFRDLPITWNQELVQHGNGRLLNTYKEDYTTNLTIDGSTTAGVGTYERIGMHYTRIGNVIFFTGVFQWTAHTGTGQMMLNALPLNNYFGIPINVPCVVDGFPNPRRPIVAQWQTWTDRILFYEQEDDGTLTPFNVPSTGRISMTGNFIRLRETT